MTLPAFATADDLAVRLAETFTGDEQAQVNALCDDASAVIREYVRQDITLVTNAQITVEAPCGPWFAPPQRPLVTVHTVAVNGQQITDYSQIGQRLYRVYGWAWPSVDTVPPLAIYGTKSTVTLNYDHGYAAVPPVFKAECLRMVARAIDNPTGKDEERIDDYSYKRHDGTPGVYLDKAGERALRRYRRGSFSIAQGTS